MAKFKVRAWVDGEEVWKVIDTAQRQEVAAKEEENHAEVQG